MARRLGCVGNDKTRLEWAHGARRAGVFHRGVAETQSGPTAIRTKISSRQIDRQHSRGSSSPPGRILQEILGTDRGTRVPAHWTDELIEDPDGDWGWENRAIQLEMGDNVANWEGNNTKCRENTFSLSRICALASPIDLLTLAPIDGAGKKDSKRKVAGCGIVGPRVAY